MSLICKNATNIFSETSLLDNLNIHHLQPCVSSSLVANVMNVQFCYSR